MEGSSTLLVEISNSQSTSASREPSLVPTKRCTKASLLETHTHQRQPLELEKDKYKNQI